MVFLFSFSMFFTVFICCYVCLFRYCYWCDVLCIVVPVLNPETKQPRSLCCYFVGPTSTKPTTEQCQFLLKEMREKVPSYAVPEYCVPLVTFPTRPGNGKLDKKEVKAAFNSFSIDTKLKKSYKIFKEAGATGVPTIIIDGNYMTSSTMAGGEQNAIDITNYIIENIRNDRKKSN